MKREWIEKVQNLLIIIMNHLLFIAVAITVQGMFKINPPKLVLWAAMGIIPFLFYLARIKIQKIVLFYAVHLLIFMGIWICPAEAITKVLMIGIGLSYLIWSVKTKMTAKTGRQGLIPAPFFVVLLGILAIVEQFLGQNKLQAYYLILALVYLMGYFVYLFTVEYQHFISTNEKSAANIPEQEIFCHGIKQTAVYSAGSVLVLVLTAYLDWFSKMMAKAGEWFLNWLRRIFAGLDLSVEEEVSREELLEEVADSADVVGEKLIPEFVLEILEKIVTVIVYVVLIAAVITVIVLIYKFLKEHFLTTDKKEAQKLQSNQDIRENCVIEKKKKKRESWFGFLSNREKVRKMFRKSVLKNKAEIIGDVNQKQLEYMTAKECCDKLREENLKEIYEKARYSAEDITAEDIRTAKAKG